LALTEEAYCWAAMFSPYGNVCGGIDPAVGKTNLDPARGAAPDSGMMGRPTGVSPAAKLILRRSSTRDAKWASGRGALERIILSPSTE
jgi:hypothetical protein